MSCYYPKLGFQNTQTKERIKYTGKNYYSDSFVGVPSVFKAPHFKALKLPCGGCLDCRLKKSREMAIRCVHEAQMSADIGNIFLTLTYAPEHIPANGTFDFSHPVKFMKRLRKLFGPGIKSYGCAEYGEDLGRPHYHLLLFGIKLTDKKYARDSDNPHMRSKLYTSSAIEKLWPYGYHIIGDVTFQSAAYVSRYVMKKNKTKTEILNTLERFHEKSICVSRRPGIGLTWLKKYYEDVYPSDQVVFKGRKGNIQKMKPPRYYDKKVVDLKLVDFEKIKLEREVLALQNDKETTQDRLMVKEEITKAKIEKLVRRYEK